jgi:hypothetical protein
MMEDDLMQGDGEREPSEHAVGRYVGLLVFLAGIAMLVLAFALAYQAFADPERIIPLRALGTVPPPTAVSVYGPAILRLLLLFVMGYIGSLIAARGAQLFFSARMERRRVAPRD